jgi:predicted transcriptional regulator
MAKNHSDAEYIDAIKKSYGFQAKVAEILGVSRSAVCQRINSNSEFLELCNDIKEELLDRAELKLHSLVDLNDFRAIKFFLNCKGKHRGYVERRENALTDQDGEPLTINISLTPAESLVKSIQEGANKKEGDGED